VSVQEKDLGWKRIKEQLELLNKSDVYVGVQEGEVNDDGASIAEYATYNEFGTERIPERPAMRQGIDSEKGRINKAKETLYGKILTGEISAETALGTLGELGQSIIQKSITALRDPANAPSTVKKKGSSNPLIDNGFYVRAIRWILR
jgi:hypothetical protein